MSAVKEKIGRGVYFASLPLLRLLFRRSMVRTRVFIAVQDEVLVIKNWISSGQWSLPGGGIHPREDPLKGALREVREEIGITLDAHDLIRLTPEPVVISHGIGLLRTIIFATKLAEKPVVKLRVTEISDMRWVAADTLGSIPDSEVLQQLEPYLANTKNLLK